MEGYLIDLMWFYWVEIFDRMGFGLLIIGLLTLAIFGIGFIESKKDKKICIIGIIIGATLIMSSLFVPSKDTMYKMMLAKITTYENLESATNQGKELIEFLTDELNEVIDNVKE